MAELACLDWNMQAHRLILGGGSQLVTVKQVGHLRTPMYVAYCNNF